MNKISIYTNSGMKIQTPNSLIFFDLINLINLNIRKRDIIKNRAMLRKSQKIALYYLLGLEECVWLFITNIKRICTFVIFTKNTFFKQLVTYRTNLSA